jgi:hypothetical protein
MNLIGATLEDLAGIQVPLRVINDVTGFSLCDDRGLLIISGFRGWNEAECARVALVTVFRGRSGSGGLVPPFQVVDVGGKWRDDPPYWIVEDAMGRHVWGGVASRENAEAGVLPTVKAIYAAGQAARAAAAAERQTRQQKPAGTPLQLVGGIE